MESVLSWRSVSWSTVLTSFIIIIMIVKVQRLHTAFVRNNEVFQETSSGLELNGDSKLISKVNFLCTGQQCSSDFFPDSFSGFLISVVVAEKTDIRHFGPVHFPNMAWMFFRFVIGKVWELRSILEPLSVDSHLDSIEAHWQVMHVFVLDDDISNLILHWLTVMSQVGWIPFPSKFDAMVVDDGLQTSNFFVCHLDQLPECHH